MKNENINVDLNPRNWLQEEYNRRRNRNNNYSLRSFARTLNISPGRLSQYFSGKRKLTIYAGKRIAENLAYSPEQEERFLNLIKKEKMKTKEKTKANTQRNKTTINDDNYYQLSVDAFHVISDWYYFAILNLIKTVDFQNNHKWIAKRLELSVVEVRTALERLYRLALIKNVSGKIVRTQKHLTTSHELESRALRLSHKQSLKQVIDNMDEVSIEKRSITSMTMAIATHKIPLAKELIKEFRRKLSTLLEDEEANEVYNLNVQLMPVTRLKKEYKHEN